LDLTHLERERTHSIKCDFGGIGRSGELSLLITVSGTRSSSETVSIISTTLTPDHLKDLEMIKNRYVKKCNNLVINLNQFIFTFTNIGTVENFSKYSRCRPFNCQSFYSYWFGVGRHRWKKRSILCSSISEFPITNPYR
jgi:hypothetical protein